MSAPVVTAPAAPGVRVGLLAAIGAALLVLLGAPGLVARESLVHQAVAVLVVWLVCLAAVARRQGAYGSAPVYLVLFGLFHGGLLFTAAVQGVDGLRVETLRWLLSPFTPTASWLVAVGMLAFTTAVIAVPRPALTGSTGKDSASAPRDGTPDRIQAAGQDSAFPGNSDRSSQRALGAVGVAVQLSGLGIFLLVLQRAGGLEVLSRGYGTFLEELDSGSPLGYGTLLLGIGTVLGVVGGGRYRVFAWTAFAFFALIALPLGTRGVVMFPLAALVVVEARRGHRLRLPTALVAGVVTLAIISVVRVTRTSGVGALLDGSWTASPLDAVAEMGHSLRPAVAVLGWHTTGEPYRNGITFIAVILRFIEQVTGWSTPGAVIDDRLFNQEVLSRVGPIGGSPVAEGYHNLGIAGVVVVMAAIGLAVALLDRRPPTPFAHATVGVIVLPLLTEVRNSAAPLLIHIAIGLAILAVARGIARAETARAAPPEPPRPTVEVIG